MTSECIVYENGSRKWYNEEGKYHREDGPAVEYTDGSKLWFRDGKLHREDGPATEYSDGEKYWYLNGVEYSEEEFLHFREGINIQPIDSLEIGDWFSRPLDKNYEGPFVITSREGSTFYCWNFHSKKMITFDSYFKVEYWPNVSIKKE
jgi:hypothetical protein